MDQSKRHTYPSSTPEHNKKYTQAYIEKYGIGRKLDLNRKWRKKNREVLKERALERFKNEPWGRTYKGIKSRCSDKKTHNYHRYGGRGIECKITLKEIKTLWLRDSAHTLIKPSIDRINNNGHYEFDNCRYIELSENSRKGVN